MVWRGNVNKLLSENLLNAAKRCLVTGSKNHHHDWVDWRMFRDVKRRKCVVDNAPARLRINALCKNDVLPAEVREQAANEIHAMPRDSCYTQTYKRCVLTSRARGMVMRWRMSRIAWRHLADHNHVSGVERAKW